MRTIRVEAKSIELALVKAAGQLGITQSHVNHRIVDEKKGWFGLWGNKVVLECWPKGGRSREPSRQTQNLHHQERLSAQGDDLKDFCKGLCERISGESVDVGLEVQRDRVILNVSSPNGFFEEQVTKNVKFVESLEHILRKKTISKTGQDGGVPVFVDAGKIRQSREEELTQMAKEMSAKVFDTKEPLVLNYRNPYDRKIIHMALDHDNKVYTKSVGSGYNRKLMILPRS